MRQLIAGKRLFIASCLYAIEQRRPALGYVAEVMAGAGDKKWSFTRIAEMTSIPFVFRTFVELADVPDYCGSGVVWARWSDKKAARAVLNGTEAAQTAIDFRAPPAVPLYRGSPWFIPVVFARDAWRDRRSCARRATDRRLGACDDSPMNLRRALRL
jgi:hypothetical protein